VDADVDTMATVPDTMRAANGTLLEDAPKIANMDIAAARSSLQAKLERNRRIRFTNFDPLSTGSGIVHDTADHNFAVQWEDSFITPDESDTPNGANA
jgi:hypothetical protein